MSQKTLRVIIALLSLQALAIGLYLLIEGQRAREPFNVDRAEGVAALPPVELTRPDVALSTSALRGRPVLLHFWATWCPPCRDELPGLLDFAREHDLRLVALSVDRDWDVVARFFGGEVPPEVYLDPSGQLLEHYGVSGLPDSYLLDEGGETRLRVAGPRDWRSPNAAAILEP